MVSTHSIKDNEGKTTYQCDQCSHKAYKFQKALDKHISVSHTIQEVNIQEVPLGPVDSHKDLRIIELEKEIEMLKAKVASQSSFIKNFKQSLLCKEPTQPVIPSLKQVRDSGHKWAGSVSNYDLRKWCSDKYGSGKGEEAKWCHNDKDLYSKHIKNQRMKEARKALLGK